MSEGSFEYKPILNKYDIFNVKSTTDDFLKHTCEKSYSLKEETKWEYLQIVLGIIASGFILKSYFHKSPFPTDKWIIIIMTLGYLIITTIMEYFQNYIYGNHFVIYNLEKGRVNELANQVSTKKNPKSSKKSTSMKDTEMKLRIGSQVKEYSNKIILEVALIGGGSSFHSSKEVEYNTYLTEKGMLVEQKIRRIFDGMLNDILGKLKTD